MRFMRAALLVLVTSCGASPGASTHEASALSPELVARVGTTEIRASDILVVATAKKTTPRDALSALIDDALAAQGAASRRLETRTDVARAITASLARRVANRIRVDAMGGGPPTDEEVSRLSKLHWREVALPERVTVVHAVALRGKNSSPEHERRAQEVAIEVEHRAKSAASVEDFERIVSAISHPDVDLRVERLPPFVEDGRLVDGEGGMDPKFSKAAFDLKKPGDLSAVVESSFGWHVIRLVDRAPPKETPFEERRLMFAEEARSMRGHEAFSGLVRTLREKARPDVSPASAELMATISTDR